jgi:hypothetical protein
MRLRACKDSSHAKPLAQPQIALCSPKLFAYDLSRRVTREKRLACTTTVRALPLAEPDLLEPSKTIGEQQDQMRSQLSRSLARTRHTQGRQGGTAAAGSHERAASVLD